MIGRLESLSFVNVQYVIDGSLEKTMMMMLEMTGWLIETTIPILYHCKNGKEKQHNQTGRIDILIIIESWIGIKNRFETNKRTLNRNVPDQWLITVKILIIIIIKISIRIRIKINISIDFNRISENGRNIYEWNQMNQTILEIDFDWTFWNE